MAGVVEIDVTGSSDVNIASTVSNGITDDARHAVLEITGTIGADIDLIVPSVDKVYLLRCNFSGAYTVTIIPSGGSAGIELSNTYKGLVYINGTGIYQIAGFIPEGTYLEPGNNLDDVADPATARTNLGVITMTDVINTLYPVGSLYFNSSDSLNPGTLFGVGTWVAFGEGRVVVGAGTGTDSNAVNRSFTAGATGGQFQHVQTIAEMPAHTHGVGATFGTSTGSESNSYSGADDSESIQSTSKGGGVAMDWMQPFVVVYCWRRAA